MKIFVERGNSIKLLLHMFQSIGGLFQSIVSVCLFQSIGGLFGAGSSAEVAVSGARLWTNEAAKLDLEAGIYIIQISPHYLYNVYVYIMLHK